MIDLNRAPAQSETSCDVCVVGAGAAGLYLAKRLSGRGLRVLILEAGGETCMEGASIGIEPVFPRSHYRGAAEGRAFGWGGSTSRWGGLLVPHSELDLRDGDDPASSAWRHIVRVVDERCQAVFSTLGIEGPPDFHSLPARALGGADAVLRSAGFATLAADFLPLRRRNLTYLVPSPREGTGVFVNSVAAKWVSRHENDGSVITAVEARSQNGNTLRVTASSFVVAAGAIESARILLEIDAATGQRALTAMGLGLADHLSCCIADVHPDDNSRASELFGPIFSKGRMRSFRFISGATGSGVPRHFAHFIFKLENPGFRLAKDVLSLLQARSGPRPGLAEILGGIGGLASLAFHRVVKSRLFMPRSTPANLQLDVEQTSDVRNRVRLGDRKDRFGRSIAVVDWSVGEADLEKIRELARYFLSRWPDRSEGFPRLIPRRTDSVDEKPHDAYHPTGVCRMGADAEAPVDLDLRVRGTRNLYTLNTGLFPSAGTANPTFSMLCLGDLLAERLAVARGEAGSVNAGCVAAVRA